MSLEPDCWNPTMDSCKMQPELSVWAPLLWGPLLCVRRHMHLMHPTAAVMTLTDQLRQPDPLHQLFASGFSMGEAQGQHHVHLLLLVSRMTMHDLRTALCSSASMRASRVCLSARITDARKQMLAGIHPELLCA